MYMTFFENGLFVVREIKSNHVTAIMFNCADAWELTIQLNERE